MREAEKLLEKAERFISDANSALANDLSLELVQNRIYYAMFSAAKAALLTEDIEVATHSSANRYVGKVFVKEKEVLSKDMGHFYSVQQTLREKADYDPDVSFEKEDIKRDLEKAEVFVEEMKDIVREE